MELSANGVTSTSDWLWCS